MKGRVNAALGFLHNAEIGVVTLDLVSGVIDFFLVVCNDCPSSRNTTRAVTNLSGVSAEVSYQDLRVSAARASQVQSGIRLVRSFP